MDLEQQMREARRYYVCGIIENAQQHSSYGRSKPAPMRWADTIEADTPRQAEDLAREMVRGMVDQGRHGNLWVAGVYQLNLDADGEIQEPAFMNVDRYAKYVDPDLTDAP